MTIPPYPASKPNPAKPAKAGPTDEQHDWIKKHFNRDMRALPNVKAGAAADALTGGQVHTAPHGTSKPHGPHATAAPRRGTPHPGSPPQTKPHVPGTAGMPHKGAPQPIILQQGEFQQSKPQQGRQPAPDTIGVSHQAAPHPSIPQQGAPQKGSLQQSKAPAPGTAGAPHQGVPQQKDTDPDNSMPSLLQNRGFKAVVRYATKGRVLDGQHRNPYDTINLFPTNRDFPSSLATTRTDRGRSALAAKENKLSPLSLEQAKGEARELPIELEGKKAAVREAREESTAARGTATAMDAEAVRAAKAIQPAPTGQAATAPGAQQAEQRFSEAHAGYTRSNEALGKAQWEVEQTEKELRHAESIVKSGRGSAETYEGFLSNGKDGASVGAGLSLGIAAVGDARKWAKGNMTGRQAATDTAVKGAVGATSSFLATGLGTELGALVGTRLAVTGAHVAEDTEKGIAVGSKFGGRTGALVGGVVAGTVSVVAAVVTAHVTEHKGADGESLVDHIVDHIGGPGPDKNKKPIPWLKSLSEATDHLSAGVQNAANFVGAQGGGAGGGRAALSVRSSNAAIRHTGDDLKVAETALQDAAKTRGAATQAVSEARKARSAATQPDQVAKAEEQFQKALTAEQDAVMAHAARDAEHEVAQKAVAAAKESLEATGYGLVKKPGLAAKAVLKWNPAKADGPFSLLWKKAQDVKATSKLDLAGAGAQTEAAEVVEGVAKKAGAKALPKFGVAMGMGTAKLFSHAGFMGAVVSGVTQTITDYSKFKKYKKGEKGGMSGWQMARDVGLQAVNGGLSGLAGAAAGAEAGAVAGTMVAGPVGLVVGTLVGTTVGMAVSLGAGVALDKLDHGIYKASKNIWGRFY